MSELPELIEAVSTHASRAAEKLRMQDGHACKVLVFAHTRPHRPGPSVSRSMVVPLRRPTSHTPLVVEAAVRAITRIYEPGYQLIKCGVMLLELQRASRIQHELDLDEPAEDKARLMTALNALNDRYGRGTLKMASTGDGPKKALGYEARAQDAGVHHPVGRCSVRNSMTLLLSSMGVGDFERGETACRIILNWLSPANLLHYPGKN